MPNEPNSQSKRGLIPLGIVVGIALLAVACFFGVEVLKTNQAAKLNGVITHQQSAWVSLREKLSYTFSSDPDHNTRAAYDVMKTDEFQYLWSYRKLRWVPLCRAKPTPCLDDSGNIFQRSPSL